MGILFFYVFESTTKEMESKWEFASRTKYSKYSTSYGYSVYFLNITRAVFISATSCEFILPQGKNLPRLRNVITIVCGFLCGYFYIFGRNENETEICCQQIIHFRYSVHF